MYVKRREGKTIPPDKSVELERIKGLVCKSPDIRGDMVADLRTRILGGVYEVKAEQVAEKIIQHAMHILGVLEEDERCPP